MFYAQVGAEWTDMSGELKAPWEQQAEQDRKRWPYLYLLDGLGPIYTY